jgi:hypothetical protein
VACAGSTAGAVAWGSAAGAAWSTAFWQPDNANATTIESMLVWMIVRMPWTLRVEGW